MSQSLEERSRERYLRWQNDWADGLAYCYHCGEEYTDAQSIVHNEEKSCPHCKEPENKTYYYCPDDGRHGCECREHNAIAI